MIGTLRRLVVGMSDSAGSAARWSMCGLIRIGEKGSRNGRHDACGRHLCLSQKIVIKRGHALDGMMAVAGMGQAMHIGWWTHQPLFLLAYYAYYAYNKDVPNN